MTMVMLLLLWAAPAQAACSDPAGSRGALMFNDTYSVVQFCDGNNWYALGGTYIPDGAVTYVRIQNVSGPGKLLGRASAGAGIVEEITIGSGLTLSGSTLSAIGGGSGGFTDHLIRQANAYGIASACPSYTTVPNSSKSLTLPAGKAAVSWSLGFYGLVATGIAVRFCFDAVCSTPQNYYTNEGSSHKLAAGNWSVNVTAGTVTAQLQLCVNAGGTAMADSNDGLSWAVGVY